MSDASERHHVTRQRADGRGALAGRHPGRLLSRVWPTPYEYRDTARHVSGSGSLTDIEGGDDVDEGEDEANVVEGVIDPSPPSMDIDQPFRHRNITSAELRSEAQYRRDYPQVRTRLEKLYISREQSGTGAVDAEQHAADSTAVDEALVAGPSSPITASAVAPLEALERRALVAMSHALTPASAAAPAVTIEQRALDTVALPPIPASPVALVEGVEHRVVAAENNPRKRGREDENAEETKAKRFCPMLRSPLCHIREQSPDDARAVECIVAAGPSTAAHPQLPVVPDNATTGESIVAAGPSTGAQPQLPFEGIVAAGPSTGVAPQLPVIVSAPAVMRSCAHLVKPWSPLTLRRHKARVKTEREARADLADRNAAGFLGDGLTLYTLAPNWQIFRLRQVTVDEREMRGPSKKKTNVRGCRGSHKSTSPVMLRRLRRPLEGHTRADRLESGRCAPEDAFDKYNMDRDRRLLRLVNVNKYQRRPAVINAVHAARARIDWSTHREESIQWCHEMQAKFTARRVAAELVAAEEAQRRAAVLAAAEEAQRVAAELAATEEAQRVAAEEANRAAEARAADERRRLAAHAEERARVERQEQLIRAERNAVNAIPRRPAPRQRQQPTTDDIMRMARRMQLEEQCRIRDDINARNVENILAQERERLAQQDRIAAEHAEEQQRRDQLDAQERALAAHHARMDEARAQAEYINQARAAQAQVQVHATSNEPGIAALRAAEARLEAFQTRSRAGSEDEVVRHVSNLHLDWDIDEQQVDGLLPAAEIVPGPRMVRRGSSASLVSSPPDYFEETEADLRAASPPPAFPPPNWSPGSQVLPTFDERHAHTHVPHANMTVAESMAYWARRANEQRNVLDAEMEINRRLAHDNRPDQPAAAHAAGIVTIEEPVRRAPIPRRSGPVNHANIEALELAQINALSDNARFRNVRAEGMFAEGPDEIGALDRQFDRLPSEPVDFEHVHHGEREPRLPGTFEPEPIDEQASQDSAQNGGVVGAILGFVRSLW